MIAILKEKIGWCPVVFCLIFYTIIIFIILYPGGALELNENKTCSRIPLTIEPSTTQSYLR